MSTLTEDEKWPALLRGQLLAATINKYTVIIRLVDQKAQVMILLNSILVPMCINAVEHGTFARGATISIVTAVLSILAAMVCIYPKRRYRKSGDRALNILHFNDIGHMDEQEYKDTILPIIITPNRLAEAAVHDLYDTSKNSIIPKFWWLKLSYGIFACGNIIALCFAFWDFAKG